MKLSVVIPVYNVEKYIKQCLDSVLAQSFTDFELILVDDGSTDSSGNVCDEYAKLDSRVRVLHTENQGVVTARRTGVNLARGEYTACIDSDDWLDLDYYRCVFETVEKTNADVLISSVVKCGGKRVETTNLHHGYYDREAMEQIIFPQMMYDTRKEHYHITPSLWNKVFRTKLLRSVYEKVDSMVTLGEDAVCTYPCIARASSVYIVKNNACYNYREDHFSMVNHCDLRLLQRVYRLAENMRYQFCDLSAVFESQIVSIIAKDGLYAARQVLVLNREVCVNERIRAVKEFFSQPIIAESFQNTYKDNCSTKLKWKLRIAMMNQPRVLLWMYACNSVVHRVWNGSP